MRFASLPRPLALLSTACVALSLSAGAAWAQTTPQGADDPTTIPHRQSHATLAQRFAEANVTHDGHLTLDQARAGLPMAARHFSAIDKDNKGYVTLDDIHAYLKAQRAAHHPTLADPAPNKS